MSKQILVCIITALVALCGIACGIKLAFSEDISGNGEFWTATDHRFPEESFDDLPYKVLQDRAAGYGQWNYGHNLSSKGLKSVYKFEGDKGQYGFAFRNDYILENFRAWNLTFLDSRALIGKRTSVNMAGSGSVKSQVAQFWNTSKGLKPDDIARTYITGEFQLNRTMMIE